MDNSSIKDVPVFILCGGKEVLFGGEKEPKACILVNGQPLLYHVIEQYRKSGFRKFYLAGGEGIERIGRLIQPDLLKIFFGKKIDDISIDLLYTGGKNGTASRILQLAENMNEAPEDISISYCDILSDIPLDKSYQNFKKNSELAQLTAANQPTRFKIIGMSLFDDKVKGFASKPILDNNYVSCGYYFMRLDQLLSKKDQIDSGTSFENDVLPELIAEKQVKYYLYEGNWQYIDSSRDIDIAESIFFS